MTGRELNERREEYGRTLGDGHAWTYAPATRARVRKGATARNVDPVALAALLREYARYGDDDGDNAFPGLRLLADELLMSKGRVQRLRDALVSEGLLIDTGRRRGRGGAAVYRLDCAIARSVPAQGEPTSATATPAPRSLASVPAQGGDASARSVREVSARCPGSVPEVGPLGGPDLDLDLDREEAAAARASSDERLHDEAVDRAFARLGELESTNGRIRRDAIAAMFRVHAGKDFGAAVAQVLAAGERGPLLSVTGLLGHILRGMPVMPPAPEPVGADLAAAWQDAREQLRAVLGEERWSLWIEALELGGQVGDELVLVSEVDVGMLRQQYGPVIGKALDGKPFRIVSATERRGAVA